MITSLPPCSGAQVIAGALTAFVSFPGRPLGADQPLELLQGGQFLAASSNSLRDLLRRRQWRSITHATQ
jgi:hypothetical protein